MLYHIWRLFFFGHGKRNGLFLYMYMYVGWLKKQVRETLHIRIVHNSKQQRMLFCDLNEPNNRAQYLKYVER